jgi:hypothetical protein
MLAHLFLLVMRFQHCAEKFADDLAASWHKPQITNPEVNKVNPSTAQ